jgi:hypothetical protein
MIDCLGALRAYRYVAWHMLACCSPAVTAVSPAYARHAWARFRALAFPGFGGCTEFYRAVVMAGACAVMLCST